MKLHDLKPAEGATRKKTRVGRGIAAGKGKTAGRGTKGAGARAGKGIAHYFEGGQLPLVRRLPFKRGFTNIFRIEHQEVHLGDLNAFDAGATVTPAMLAEAGLIRKADQPVVILGDGDIDRALTVQAHRVTKSAAERIAKAGGTVQKLEYLVTGARATVKKMRKEDLAKLAEKA
ncbi:MAG: 50S ribosomal protein L15 [Chloroflexi bacterium]|jgi:large subunit ribosomal protein L15|nr:MAG: 50S ribosomal protein L15 [Chloroflexi bacterium OLB13]MBC6957680.1 50S ribosomal protein L15 [Chloroflexota bacterium]MBV6434858.1 50S ribosomal protein L15 [Anaerolineae bacterium]MDL1916334.1 50S ribosomal protein L15 [Anaerolineae bacterium CFX4]OQY83847.1 MAG: 50S ribosomal protein L15 [Anaerolineae bacterium UTCFX5]